MLYSHTAAATFLCRPNRFLARVAFEGQELVCHVKNTGRLKELLLPQTPIIIQHHPDAAAQGRKTEYSLIGVWKRTPAGDVLVNIDSQAPNAAAFTWLSEGRDLPFSARPKQLRREVVYGDSRFDLAFAVNQVPWFMEVKGVTLEAEDGGRALFPDAPTERGIKHLHELSRAAQNGCGAAVLFVIQRKGISSFSPNPAHPEFGQALLEAERAGVRIFARDCIVTPGDMKLDAPVPVVL